MKMLRLIPFRKHDKALAKKAKQRSQASRKQPKQDVQLHINKRYVVLALVLIALTTLVALLPKEQWLPIEKIRIMGEFKQLDTNKLQAQLKPYLGAGFFSVNIQRIQEKVAQQPWISEVSVSRVWPSKIVVRVTEKEAFARWDDTHLLSTRAEVFAADSSAFKDLPLINGYQGQSEQLLEKYLSLKQKLKQYGIQLTALHEDSKGAISLLLGDHLKVNLGTEDTEQKINNMLAVYPLQIKPKSDQIQYIDFRYSNGFAIAWKKEDSQKLSDIKRGNKNV
jgi:cell division protein FtsQ